MAGLIKAFHAQRNLNNAFAYDLVPSVSVIAAALKAARRVNDFPTAVRIFEGMLSHPIFTLSDAPEIRGKFAKQTYCCESVFVIGSMASCRSVD